MRILRRLALPLVVAAFTACGGGPSRGDALDALRVAYPAVDTTTAYGRVWQDGPPWFSCDELKAKFTGWRDTAVVRDQVGNWKPLVEHGWITLRDTAQGVVADPGWCIATPTAFGLRAISRWTVARGPTFPTGSPRRAWTMTIGHRQLVVDESPNATGKDSANAAYLVIVTPNPDGAVLGTAGDTARYLAQLQRVGGRWRVTSTRRTEKR